YQVFELEKFIFITDQNSTDQPILVDNALLVKTLASIDENNLLIGMIGAINQTDATQIESLYLDDINKHASLIDTPHITMVVPCCHRALLFRRSSDPI